MARSQEALITPAVLVWARETRRFPIAIAAQKIGVSEETLKSWEDGNSRPSVAQLRKIADVYKRPLAAFFLPHPPESRPSPRDYRRLGESQGMSPELALEVRKILEMQSVAAELSQDGDGLSLQASLTEAPEEVSRRLRSFLEISVEEQFRTKDPSESLRLWRTKIESRGVFVFQMPNVSVEEVRGIAFFDRRAPAIALNSKDAPNARVFSLLHELAHLLLREGGICTQDESVRVEVFCNRVAGLTLVPTEELLSQRRDQKGQVLSVRALALRFGVSEEVVARRLLDLGEISKAEYESHRSAPRQSLPRKRSSGGPTWYVVLASQLGSLYPKTVLDAYHQDRISGLDASRHLGVKFDQIEKLELALR